MQLYEIENMGIKMQGDSQHYIDNHPELRGTLLLNKGLLSFLLLMMSP